MYQRVSRRSEATKRIEWDRRAGVVRGRVCGQSEIRRIKGGFVCLEGGSIRGYNVICQTIGVARIRLRARGRARTRAGNYDHRAARARDEPRRATTREVSLEPQLVNELKTLPPPHPLIFTREQRNYVAGVLCGFCR